MPPQHTLPHHPDRTARTRQPHIGAARQPAAPPRPADPPAGQARAVPLAGLVGLGPDQGRACPRVGHPRPGSPVFGVRS